VTYTEWLDTYGVPEDWALALALLEQMEDYRRAAHLVQQSDTAVAELLTGAAALFGDATPERVAAVRASAERRVRQSVIDLQAAAAKAGAIASSGGWGWLIRQEDPQHG